MLLTKSLKLTLESKSGVTNNTIFFVVTLSSDTLLFYGYPKHPHVYTDTHTYFKLSKKRHYKKKKKFKKKKLTHTLFFLIKKSLNLKLCF
jgi:hypothetical protein